MKFRLKALFLHLLCSVAALTLILAAFYFGWYRWPGWYLADALHVVGVLMGVDLVLGPMLTGVIANERKPRRELVRDIGVIVAVQVCALLYGGHSLWEGRPLYYAQCDSVLHLIQAYDIDAGELALARKQNDPVVPHWYSLPSWIYVPLPADPKERNQLVLSSVSGGLDIVAMPRYYRPLEQGRTDLRTQLKKVADQSAFTADGKQKLIARMRAAGLDANQANSMILTGRGPTMLAVYDLTTLNVRAFLRAD